MYDAGAGTDVDELLDDVDALLVSVWHLYDWIKNDSALDSRIPKRVDAFVSSSKALRMCRDYVNSYKHRVRDRPSARYARILEYRREAGTRPAVRIVSWVGPVPPDEFTESIEALDLARQGMDEWALFADECGDPTGILGVQTPDA